MKCMIFLEGRGYYHIDIRTMNFLYDEEQNKIFLIDYGSLREKSEMPEAVILAIYGFFSVAVQIFEKTVGKNTEYDILRGAIDLKKYLTPEQYRKLLALEIDDKFFANMYEVIFGAGEKIPAKAAYTLQDYEILQMERLIEGARNDRQKNFLQFSARFQRVDEMLKNMTDVIGNLTNALVQQNERISELEKISRR